MAEHYLKQMIAIIEVNEKRTHKRRLTDYERFKDAVQMVVSDLLGNYSKASHNWSYINLRAESFSNSKVGYKTFVQIVKHKLFREFAERDSWVPHCVFNLVKEHSTVGAKLVMHFHTT
jgi:hypothetical protein